MNLITRFTISLIAASLFISGACSAHSADAESVPDEPVQVSFDNPLNLIVLELWIGDEGPFRFALDSGATSTVIDTDLVKRIGLETAPASTRPGTTAGSQVTFAPINGGVTFTFAPDFDVHVNRVIAGPFTKAGHMMLGEHLDGLLGSAIFHQLVVEVRYAEQVLIFHDPAGFKYDGDGSILELDFPKQTPRLPFIKATLVNGANKLVDFPILVDSGGKTMGTASVATRGEWDALITPDNPIVDVLGATGLSNDPEDTTHDAFVTRMEQMTIGPFTFRDPFVSYSEGGSNLAVMGATLLHRFTTIYDYSRKRLILKPNADFNNPHRYDHSGTMLVMSDDADENDTAFRILFIADGTPAHEAGLKRNDIVLAIDGVPVRNIHLNDARAMLSRSQEYRLQVQREEHIFEVVIQTRPLFDE